MIMGWWCSHWDKGHNIHIGRPTESVVIWGQEVWLLGFSVIISCLIHKNSLAYVLYDFNETMEASLQQVVYVLIGVYVITPILEGQLRV